MAGVFTLNETKVRPGTYFNIQKKNDGSGVSYDGVAAVLFRADWGPLNEAVLVDAADGYEKVFGTALTTDAIQYVFAGGATTALCCRVGKGGTAAAISLKKEGAGESEGPLVTIQARYVGAKEFSLTIKDKLTDPAKRICVIYDGVKEFEKVEFAKGGDEAGALTAAFSNSNNFIVEKEADASGALAAVSQAAFTFGTNPTAEAEDYSNGLAAIEMYSANTICVDTEDSAVHALLEGYINRIFQNGQLTQGVIAEKKELPLAERIEHAAAYNSEKMVYVLNSAVVERGKEIEGYQTAALIAGMIASYPSNRSLTHAVLTGVSQLNERLTPSRMDEAELKGCLVLSVNAKREVQIDSAINTLVSPAESQDEGWKKIRRTKTRYELLRRMNEKADALIGQIDNDINGRATLISQLQAIGTTMIEEGKLVQCQVKESGGSMAQTDSAWFDVDVIDKESAEHIYLTYLFRFNTQEA